MNEEKPCVCGGKYFDDQGGYGIAFCLNCGVGRPSMLNAHVPFTFQERISGYQSYTRLKRFKKYLCRAMRQQSCCTVPKATWDYLLEHAPYQDTRHIQYTLKRARHLKRKCYDSLPFLTAALCPLVKVPSLTQQEKHQALQLFQTIDGAIREGPFVSYLFCLEYILKKMGRQDLCEFINRIQCNKRRAAYTTKLNDIFAAGSRDIKSLLRTFV